MSPGDIHKRIESVTRQEHLELISFIRQYVQSAYIAEDVLQETYLEALKQAEQIKDPTKLIVWMKTVAKRIAIRETAKQNRLTKKLAYLIHIPSLSIEDEVVNRIFLIGLLNEVFQKFPLYYRRILYCRNVYNMSYSQIAGELGIKSVTARKAHSRIMKELKKMVQREINQG